MKEIYSELLRNGKTIAPSKITDLQQVVIMANSQGYEVYKVGNELLMQKIKGK